MGMAPTDRNHARLTAGPRTPGPRGVGIHKKHTQGVPQGHAVPQPVAQALSLPLGSMQAELTQFREQGYFLSPDPLIDTETILLFPSFI